MKKIGIIGFGTSGVSFLAQFIEEIKIKKYNPRNFNIIIFEKDKTQLGTGKAYSKNTPLPMLLNSSICLSNVITDNQDFYYWILRNKNKLLKEFGDLSSITQNSYVPRKLFGLYVTDKFQEMLQEAKRLNLKVNIVIDEVIDIKRFENKTVLLTKFTKHPIDILIFSTGHFEKQYPFEHIESPNLFKSPYYPELYHKKFKRTDRILILGSRLSAIDAVMVLANGIQKITITSRSGLMPMVKHQDKATVSPINLSIEDISKIDRLTAKEIFESIKADLIYKYKDSELVDNLISPKTALFSFIQSIELAKKNILHWQDIFTPYDNYFDFLWGKLNIKEQSIFLKDYLPCITRFTSSFPLENAIKINEMVSNDRLRILSGLKDIKYEKHAKYQFTAIFDDKRNECFNYVICALGYDYDLNNQHLYKQLKKGRMISYNACGGLSVKLDTMHVQNHNFSIPTFAIGSPIFGSKIFTNVLSSNVKDAFKIVKMILT